MQTILTPKTEKQIKKLAQKHELDLVVLFGSIARDETHFKSDIDLAVKAKKQLSYYDEAVLREEFCKIFGRDDVDVIALNNAHSPLLLKFIAAEGKVLYSRLPHFFAEFQMYAFKLYFEAKPLFRARQAQLEAHLAKHQK